MSMDIMSGGGQDIDKVQVFSPKMFVLFAICGVVGIVFGVAFMSGQNANALLEIRKNDAKSLAKTATPKIAEFDSVVEDVKKLDPNIPDPDLAKKLAETDFALPGSVLSTVTIPLPGSATDLVAQYTADTTHLKTLLDHHARMTTKVDSEELEQLAENNKALEGNKAFGILFDAEHVRKNSESEKYVPKEGRLVGVKDFDKEKNVFQVEFLGSGNEGEVPPEKFIPISVTQILKSGGQNALSRHQKRVRNIQYYTKKIDDYTGNIVDALDAAAAGDESAPAAVDSEPAAEPEPQPEPAEEVAEPAE